MQYFLVIGPSRQPRQGLCQLKCKLDMIASPSVNVDPIMESCGDPV